MSRASIDGHEIFYDRAGSGEPLLLVMGMAGTHRTWGEPFVDALRESFDTVVYDHRGVGLSSRAQAGFSIADLAGDAAALLDALEWESAHIVGISMGGMVAQELALRHAARVRTLTLGCTYAGGPGSALAGEAVAGRLGAAWTSGDRELAIRAGWEVNVSGTFAGDDERYATFREQALALSAPLPMILAQMQAIGDHDTSTRLGEIEAPALVVHGTADEMLPVANAHAIAERMPGARLELFEGVGHLFFWERPDESARLVREHALAAKA